ncbi:helix-turn-helix domain-containing protein [Nocardia sp. 2]|uniref:Helix-turn-helix domain-containing protein n=1 Tax=Nocardia acididurans TaxID=2802282 RepID=A0ABS1LWX7_9NOCA|nr:helix-turn-helix domain-containing protein [Nocardia acididurans]MBL1072783.1 helix-turn-helix domain-containing protein [Nocardia acididurans]
MALVFDTELIDPRDRADAVATAVAQMSAPAHMVCDGDGERIESRIEAWDFGAVNVVRARITGFDLTRTTKLVRTAPAGAMEILAMHTGTIRHRQGDEQRECVGGGLFGLDFDAPYRVGAPHSGEMTAVVVPVERLGLPMETVRVGAAQADLSPLSALVANQVVLLGDSAERLAADTAAPLLGEVCVDMVRALLVSAASGGRDGAMLPADLLLTQIREYVRRRLADPDLTPARIARAHSVSVRQLYKLCAESGFRLEQWIIGQRLERVREELRLPRNRSRSIAAVAQRWGFRDSSHFARRFRAEYGMSPREWRNT